MGPLIERMAGSLVDAFVARAQGLGAGVDAAAGAVAGGVCASAGSAIRKAVEQATKSRGDIVG